MRDRLKSLLLPRWRGTYFYILVLALFIIHNHTHSRGIQVLEFDFQTCIAVILSFISLTLITEGASSLCKRNYSRVSFGVISYMIYHVLFIYQKRTRSKFDIVVFINNFNETFSKESMDVALSVFVSRYYDEILCVLIFILLLEFKLKI